MSLLFDLALGWIQFFDHYIIIKEISNVYNFYFTHKYLIQH